MSVSLDVRYGFRRLNQNVGSTVVAVLCLALGVCGSVIVFSLSDFLLVRALPGVQHQSRLVSIGTQPVTFVEGEAITYGINTSTFQRYRDSSHSFTQLAAYYHSVRLNVSGAGNPVIAVGQIVSSDYFTTLGMSSAAGRLFSPGDSARGGPLEAVISHDLWRLYGFRPQAIGASIRLNGQVFTVVGVAPQGFHGLLHGNEADVWVPLEAAPAILPMFREVARRGFSEPHWLMWFVGRLAPGVDRRQAQEELDQLASRLGVGLPKDQKPPRLIVYPGVGFWPGYRPYVAEPLRLLAVIAFLLMLVVCANLGGLLLVRAASHQEEIGVRLALGVTRGRLVRQLLSESLALALVGGAAGFTLSLFAVDLLRGLAIAKLRLPVAQISLGFRVVLFTLVLSLVTGVLCGLVPALWATRRRVAPLLRGGTGDSTMQRGHMRLQEGFVIAQVTVSLLLLVSTGLFVRTLQNLRRVDPGFASEGVLNGRIDLSAEDYSPARGLAFYNQLLEQAKQLAGVRAAALTLAVPLSSDTGEINTTDLRTPDGPRAKPFGPVEYNVVSPGFFATLGIPLRGRDFQASDQPGSLPVAIVDERLARILWPKRNPIGQRIALGNQEIREIREVVGVAGQIRYVELFEEPRPFFYVPAAQAFVPRLTLQLRTADFQRSASSLRAIVRRLDPNLAVQISRYDGDVQQTLGQPRLFSRILGIFSTTAVLVTAIGLYGTLAYAMSRRTRELGIRMALGARASEIVLMVLRRGLTLTLAGLVLGILAASWATAIFSDLLFGVEPTDPVTFLAVSLLLILVGLAASSLPAYRATRVDPMSIIRHE